MSLRSWNGETSFVNLLFFSFQCFRCLTHFLVQPVSWIVDSSSASRESHWFEATLKFIAVITRVQNWGNSVQSTIWHPMYPTCILILTFYPCLCPKVVFSLLTDIYWIICLICSSSVFKLWWQWWTQLCWRRLHKYRRKLPTFFHHILNMLSGPYKYCLFILKYLSPFVGNRWLQE
jgi:hypothetical protein